MAEKTVPDVTAPTEAQQSQEITREQERFVRAPVDIYETREGLVVVADLPGVAKDDLNVDVHNQVLTIQARTSVPPAGTPLHREFELTGFYRQFQLSDQVESEGITAEFKHGVLTLRLPRAAAAQPRRIDVQMG